MKQTLPVQEKLSATHLANVAWAQQEFRQGLTLHQGGQLLEAQLVYERVLELVPQHFDAMHLSGVIAYQRNDPGRAVELIGRAIDVNCSVAAAHTNLGNALSDLGNHEAALACFNRSIALQPDDPTAHNNRGKALADLEDFENSLASYERAIALNPNYAEAYNNRGNTLRALAQYEAALASFETAAFLKPSYAEAHTNHGHTLQDRGQHSAAVADYDRALALKPDCAVAHYGRGVSLDHVRDHAAAIACYDRAIALQAEGAEFYNARGNAYRALGEPMAALQDYATAVRLEPGRADFHYNRGAALDDLADYQGALDSYGKVLALDPRYPYLAGMYLYLQRRICSWRDGDERIDKLAAAIQRGSKVASPFSAVALTVLPAIQHQAAQVWVRDCHPERPDPRPLVHHARRDRIRIGYFSADFHDHATAYLIAELFETHDRTRFEVFGFSFGPCRDNAMGRRLRAGFDGFLDVRTLSDPEVALLARQLCIDIAVDLKGFTAGNRLDIFAHRAAPIQVNYLGYPGTMGTSYMDYIIADRILIPEAERRHYSEKVAYLPHTYQVNDRRRRIADRIYRREELGLPRNGFVFCCFNNNYKITAPVFDGWMRILEKVEGSVLWLLEDNALASANLRDEAVRRNTDPGRLIFAPRLPLAEHLARHHGADLFLDTTPYNAHTTASDALWSALPVLTLTGGTFSGRVASSLLTALGLPELITATSQEYEAMAVHLATHPRTLKALKEKLARNKLTEPLFDTPLFTRHLEDAFMQMHETHLKGLAPVHVVVKAAARTGDGEMPSG